MEDPGLLALQEWLKVTKIQNKLKEFILMIHEVQNDLIIKDKDIKEKLSKIDDFIE